MKRLKIWLIVVAAVTALLLVVAWTSVLPKLIEREIVLALQKRGLSEVTVTTQAVTFKRAALHDFSIGMEKRFKVSDIAIDYTLSSLMQGRVGAILMTGAELDVRTQKGVVDWGPLANFSGEGEAGLPFDRLELRASTLILHWDGRHYRVPVEATLQNSGDHVSTINLKATLNRAQITLKARADINTFAGSGDIELSGLTAEFFQEIGAAFFPTDKITSEGRLNARGHFTSKNDRWQAELTLTGEGFGVHTEVEPLNLELSLTSLQGEVEVISDSLSTFKLRALLNEAPVTLSVTADIHTLEGECAIDILGLDAEMLEGISASYLPTQALTSKGRIAIKGHVAYKKGHGFATLMLSGSQLSIETQVTGLDLKVTPDTLISKVEFAQKSGEMRVKQGRLQVSGWSIVNKSNGITVEDLSCTLPYFWAEKEILGGLFTFGPIHFGQQSLPKFAGTIDLRKDRLNLTANGPLLPKANLDASCWLDLSGDEPYGELSAHIPRFTTENGDALGEQFPALDGSELGGTFALKVQMKREEGQLRPYLRLDAQDAMWKKPSSDVGLEGLTGVLRLNNFLPMTTAGDQRFTIKRAYSGALQVTNGVMDFSIANNDSIFLKLIKFEWAGGKLLSRDMFLEPSKSRVSLDLHVEGLQLQKILDFLKYDGVKGDGALYGHLPIHLDWSGDGHISFGDGFLQARPAKGRLQVSKENAMAILGISEEIDPHTASQQERVSLMLLRALQDMEYTKLKVVFKNEPDTGWVTHVQAQGYGPRGEKENQVPIGGLDININALDELLNSIVFSKLDMSQIKFGTQ